MFLSLPFVILFTCCLILYYTVKGSYQKPVLLLTSCIFVGYFNIAYLLIAALIAAITFYWGRWIGMQEQENKRHHHALEYLAHPKIPSFVSSSSPRMKNREMSMMTIRISEMAEPTPGL